MDDWAVSDTNISGCQFSTQTCSNHFPYTESHKSTPSPCYTHKGYASMPLSKDVFVCEGGSVDVEARNLVVMVIDHTCSECAENVSQCELFPGSAQLSEEAPGRPDGWLCFTICTVDAFANVCWWFMDSISDCSLVIVSHSTIHSSCHGHFWCHNLSMCLRLSEFS